MSDNVLYWLLIVVQMDALEIVNLPITCWYMSAYWLKILLLVRRSWVRIPKPQSDLVFLLYKLVGTAISPDGK